MIVEKRMETPDWGLGFKIRRMGYFLEGPFDLRGTYLGLQKRLKFQRGPLKG